MAKTTFGSVAGSNPTTFKSQGAEQIGPGGGDTALRGVTKFQGSGGAGISQGGTAARSKTMGTYNKEYGMRLTKDQVGELKEAESDFQKRLNEYSASVNEKISGAQSAIAKEQERLAAGKAKGEGEIKNAQGMVKKGWGQIQDAAKQNTVEGMFNQWWKAEKKVPVRVVADGKVEGTYVMPKTAAMKIMEDKGINANWVDGGKRLNIDVKQQGRIRGQELHDALRVGTSRDSMLTEFNKNKEVHQHINKNRQSLARSAAELRAAEAKVKQAEAQFKGEVAQQEQNIKGAEFETKELGKTRDREVKGAKDLAEGQKKKRAELYQKWMDARAKAYQTLQKMEVK